VHLAQPASRAWCASSGGVRATRSPRLTPIHWYGANGSSTPLPSSSAGLTSSGPPKHRAEAQEDGQDDGHHCGTRDYSSLKGLQGITDDQIAVHLALYSGYVARSNKLLDTLASMANEDKAGSFEYSELKRRAGWEVNGILLHEYYFDNLAPNGGSGEVSKFAEAVSRQYGSFADWKKDFLAVAKMPGVGWAVTYFDPLRHQFDNYWIDRHDIGHPAGHRPVVVLDLWEHAWSAYLKPTERARYLDDFFANVSWPVVDGRLAG
jgi:Fe-Mn family superoxide dismutase